MLALESNVASAWELYKKLSPGENESTTKLTLENTVSKLWFQIMTKMGHHMMNYMT